MKGFPRRNLYAIRQWYKFYSAKYQFVPQCVAQIPWGHNRLVISKVKEIETVCKLGLFSIRSCKECLDL